MELSPQLESFLASMEYPATKDDLMRESARDGLSAQDRAVLATLPDIGFSARWQIRRQLARTEGTRAVPRFALAEA